jgi:hypothetical protein
MRYRERPVLDYSRLRWYRDMSTTYRLTADYVLPCALRPLARVTVIGLEHLPRGPYELTFPGPTRYPCSIWDFSVVYTWWSQRATRSRWREDAHRGLLHDAFRHSTIRAAAGCPSQLAQVGPYPVR